MTHNHTSAHNPLGRSPSFSCALPFSRAFLLCENNFSLFSFLDSSLLHRILLLAVRALSISDLWLPSLKIEKLHRGCLVLLKLL